MTLQTGVTTASSYINLAVVGLSFVIGFFTWTQYSVVQLKLHILCKKSIGHFSILTYFFDEREKLPIVFFDMEDFDLKKKNVI